MAISLLTPPLPVATSRARNQAVIELVFAAALWGFGFVGAVWALRSMGPIAITGWRFAIAAAVGFSIMAFSKQMRASVTSEMIRLAAVPGFLIATMLILQTWGLKYTTATKSGFITTLYVLIVPLIESFWFKKKIGRLHIAAVTMALLGVALICNLPGEIMGTSDGTSNSWNIGDLLTLLCAVAGSFQIIWFGLISHKISDSFVFNNFQSLWAGVPALLLAFMIEPVTMPNWSDHSLTGLLVLGLGSSLIAFALQIKAQKILSPSFASLLFLLESPFATLFGIALLGESLQTMQWFGAGLILLAAGLSTALGSKEV